MVAGGAFTALLLTSVLALHGAFAAVDVNSLLWPIPKQVTVTDDTVRALDPDKFQFMTDVNSAILNEAFIRYMGVIFKAPLAFIPDGASENVKVEMAMLNVKVTSGDETLGEDTDESCK